MESFKYNRSSEITGFLWIFNDISIMAGPTGRKIVLYGRDDELEHRSR